jgi:urea transport system ATP-binding protein
MLIVNRLNQFYGESHILWDVDLWIPPGSTTCLIGRNGMGKTTLLKCVMGLLPTRGGEIRMDGQELAGKPAAQRARAGIGYVPQGREIFSQLSVEENLQVPLAALRGRAAKIPDWIFEIFPVLANMRKRRGGDLSGGQQQQLAIGRALVLDPKLLILDEPTEGIQPNIVHEIGEVIRRLNHEKGLTVLLVEQKLPFARRAGSHFCILERGRSVATGAMEELNDDLIARHLSV